MDNFDYKKYLAKGILLKENEESPMARQIYTNSPLRKLIISFIESDLSPGQSIEKVFSGGSMDEIAKMYIEKYVTEEDPHYKAIADSKADIQFYLNALKMHLQGRLDEALLNESAPGYDTRKFGEALPTLESVKAAHEAKEDDKKNLNETRDEEVQTMASILINAMGTSTTLENLIYAMSTDDAKLYLGAMMRDNDLVMDDDADEDAMASIMMDAPDRY
tara:strand:- start:56 stop:712 length:657 start_codon:yes stop_codon:yes gene_type:complete